MSENKTKQYLSVGIVLLFVMSAFGSIVNTGLFGDDMMADVLYENGSNDGNILIDQDGNDGLAKMDGSLQELVKNPTKGLTRVIIATTDPAEVATFLKDYEYRGLIGTRPISNGLDLSTYTLEVPIDCLDKLTELSSVYGIYSHPEQDASHYTEEANIGGSTGGLTPQNIYDVEQHNLLEAWSMGYIGTDSRVAIAEGGIDFGHPDLWETQARVPESLTVKGFTLIEAVGGEITAFIEQSDIVSGSYKFYINGTELTETTDYTFDLATGNLTLNSALEYGEILTTDYQFISPYAGWPIVFDYYSMSTYLETSSTLDTWYVATNETAEPYTEVGYPQLDLEIDIEMEETFSADPAESKTTTDLEHKTIKQNSVVVYADGNLISDTLYAVNYDLGQITFTPPIDVMKIEASYTYYQWDDVPVDQRVILQSPDYIPSEEGIPESYTISGLEPNENYFISIRATDEAKNHGDFSNNPEAATITDTTPPNQIIDLVATPGDVHGTLRLQWTAPGDDDVVGTTQSYVVKYSDKPITNWVCFDYMSEEYIQSWTPAVAGTAEDFALTGLPTGKDYYFAILAIDEGGNLGEVSNSPVAFVKQDTIDPSGISPIASTGMNDTEIYLQFDAPSDDAGIGTVTSYVLKYDTTDITDQTEFDAATTYPQTWTPAVAGTTVIYTLSLPASITDYYFSIIGVDEAGNTGPISSPAAMAQSQGPDIIDCSQIADLAVTTGTDHGMVDLTFTAPGDDGAVGWATEYIIKFNTTSIDSEADWDAVPEVNAISGTYAYPVDAPLESGVTQSFTLGVTNLDFSNLPPGVDYYFAIRAMDEEGNLGPVSNCDNALVQDDSIPPEAIDDLTVAVSPNHGEVILSWTAPGDDGAVGQASYYQIAYATYEITPANFDSAIAVNGTTRAVEHAAGFSESLDFSGYGLDLGTTYYFAIMGMDEARVNDPVSNCVNSIPRNDNATPSTIALVVATSDQHGSIDLTWDAPGDDGSTGTVTSYEIRYMAGYDENKYVDADIGYVGVLNPVMRWTTYDVTGIDSASGIYRLGTLNDENLATYVNAAAGEDPTYSKVLLVDSTTPYVYDTVYVDMDADQSFRDEKACVKGDEVAWRDMDGDGLADRAGGMVYYISQANTLGTTLEALTIVNGSVELVNQNIINNSAIIHWEGSRAGVDISAKIVKNKAVLDHDNVANVVLYLNGTALTGGDYIIDLETGAIDFIMNINTSYHEITTDYDFNTIMDSADYIVDIEEGIIGFSNIEEDDVLSAYYEWDGLPIPYSDVLADRKGVDNVIPQNGAMVAMYGEYAIDITDGTSRASAVVGKGMSSHKNDVDVKPCLGLAPDAKIVSIVDTGYDGMIFAIDGYDGIPGTGDEATIYSSSLASTVYEAGGDFQSRYVDWLATEYGEGKVVFTASTGGAGPGYSTIASPGSAPGVITAGLATDLFYRIVEEQDTGPNPTYGDIISVSGRGPTMMGNPKPDVVTTGAYFGFASMPLWTDYDRGPNADYTNVVDILGWHGMASSNLAASIAIIADAYDGAHPGEVLDTETARAILMSGADDINYDVFSQGAGFVNATQSSIIASESGGSIITPTSWVPGDYEGERHDAFVKTIGENTLPENLVQEFTIENTGTTTATADVMAGEMLKIGEGVTMITVTEADPHGWTILNDTGFYNAFGELLKPVNQTYWWDSDLAKVTMYSNNSDFWLELFDWTDENEDGMIEGDLTSGPYGPGIAFAERNRMNGAFIGGNVLECRFHNNTDFNRISDGVAIWSRIMDAVTDYQDIYLKVEYFKRQAWDWMTITDGSAMSIAPGDTGTFTATLDPAKAIAEGVGTYEGAITADVDGKITVIPISVNVEASNPNFEFGGDPALSTSENHIGFEGIRSTMDESCEHNTSAANVTTFQLGMSSGESTIRLAYDKIVNQTFIVVDGNGTDVIISPYEWGPKGNNETVLDGDADGTFDTLTLENQNIILGSERFHVYVSAWASWFWVSTTENTFIGTFDNVTGVFTYNSGMLGNFVPGDYFYAWYNYTETGPFVLEEDMYTMNDLTGKGTLTEDMFYYHNASGNLTHGLHINSTVSASYDQKIYQDKFRLANSNVIEETFDVIENGKALSKFDSVEKEILLNNSNEVKGEIVIIADDNVTTTAQLANGAGSEEIGPGTYTLYLDGEEMIEMDDGENIDYIFNQRTGEITFMAPLSWGMNVTANYVAFEVGVLYLYLGNNSVYDGDKRVDPFGSLLLRNGKSLTEGTEYFFAITPIKNETIVENAIGGEGSFSLANTGILPASDNAFYVRNLTYNASAYYQYTEHYYRLTESATPGVNNYTINYIDGGFSLNGWTLATGDSIYGYYNYSGCNEGKIKLNMFNTIENEVVIESATDGQTTFELLYGNLDTKGKKAPNTLYFMNSTHTIQMLNTGFNASVNGSLNMFNYIIDNVTGIVKLNNWTLSAGDKITAWYNYTGLISGDFFEMDYSYGRYDFDAVSGRLEFLTPPPNNAAVDLTFEYYDCNRLFDPAIMLSGFDGSGGKAGDWRYYYVNIPEQGVFTDPNTKLLINAEWWKGQTNIDAFSFGKLGLTNPETETSFDGDRYGPYGLQNNGGSTETAGFFTASGGPIEYSTPDIGPGLNVIALHAVGMNGSSNIEPINGQVGTLSLDKDKVSIVTSELAGSASVSGVANMDLGGFMGGVAAGPSAPVSYKDLEVWEDEADWSLFDTFEDQLSSGNTTIPVTLEDCLIFDVHIYGHDNAPDLDLGVFLDSNGDGLPQGDENIAIGADWDADEQVKLIGPEDGDYIIVIYGFWLKTIPAYFDIDITNVQGLGFGVNGEGEDLTPDDDDQWKNDEPLPAYTTTGLDLEFDLAGAKNGVTLQGALYIGPGEAPYTMLLPIELRYDTVEPTVSGVSPIQGAVSRDKQPIVTANFNDFDFGELQRNTARMWLDGVDITAQTSINVALVDDDEAPVQGYPDGAITYLPSGPMDDGVHIVEASMEDLAGNEKYISWTFIIDSGMPSLEVTQPAEAVVYTSMANYMIKGNVETSTSLEVMGANIEQIIQEKGTFSADITLEPGNNLITIATTDFAGNRAETKRLIILDTSIPTFEGFISLQGSRTNSDKVTIAGEVSETGTMTINSQDTIVNSDGSFSKIIDLKEGENTLHLIFIDRAGNLIDDWMNITLDKTLPEVVLIDLPTLVHSNNFSFSAQIIEDELEIGGVRVNGKQVSVTETRGISEFDRTVFLSHGLNTIVIEVTDKAGNVVELRHTVEYAPETGTNNAAIGMMIALLIIGLVAGFFIAMMIWKETPEEVEPTSEIIDEDAEKPEGEDIESIDEEVSEGDIPLDDEETEIMSDEEMSSEEIGDAIIDEEVPEGEFETPDEEFGDDMGEDMPEGEMDDLSETPDEDPEDIGAAIVDEEFPEEEMPDEIELEDEIIEAEPEELEADEPAVSEEVDESLEEDIPEIDEDPRISKLRQALEDGKISQELFDKNIARIKSD